MEIIKLAPRGKITTLEPGIYSGLPADQYHGLPYASQSTIKAVNRSVEKFEYRRDLPPLEMTPEVIRKLESGMWFGTWYHTFLLQSEEFDEHYVEGPARRQSATDKERHRQLAELYGGFQAVYRPKHREKMTWMQNAFMGYNFPRKILDEPGHSELSIIWDETAVVDGEEVKIRCKARIDRYNIPRRAGCDLKTDRDTDMLFNNNKFFKEPLEYHVQGGFYRRGLVQNGVPCDMFFYFAQEKEPPYQVRYTEVGEDVLSRGWTDAREYLDTYARYLKYGFEQPPCELLLLPDYMQ
jgi:hypothetical protein